MTPAAFWSVILLPNANALSWATGVTNSKQARVLLMAIAGHETGWAHRIQIPGGEARGYWQCEKHGAVAGVINDPVTGPLLDNFCAARNIPFDLATVFEAIAWHDALALAVARLALWQDPAHLPAVGDSAGALAIYLKVWRPGRPRPETWPATYQQSLAIVT